MRKTVFFSLVLTILLSVSVFALDGSIDTESGEISPVTVTTLEELIHAVDEAEDGTIIKIARQIYIKNRTIVTDKHVTLQPDSSLTSSYMITIQDGATLDGLSFDTSNINKILLYCDAKNSATIQNCNFSGSSSVNQIIIYLTLNKVLRLNNCDFTNIFGYCIYCINKADIELNNCIFHNCRNTIADFNSSKVFLNDCIIADNAFSIAAIISMDGDISFNNCQINNNNGKTDGLKSDLRVRGKLSFSSDSKVSGGFYSFLTGEKLTLPYSETISRITDFAYLGDNQAAKAFGLAYDENEPLVSEPIIINKYVEVEKTIEVPVEIEKIVEVPVTVEVEKIVEVPVEIEKIVTVEVEKPIEVVKYIEVEKPVEIEKVVEIEKNVEVPVEVEKIVTIEVEKPIEIEKIVEVEKPVEIEKIVEVEKPVTVEVEKVIEVPVEVEKIIEVASPPEIVTKYVPVHHTETVEVERVIEKVVEVAPTQKTAELNGVTLQQDTSFLIGYYAALKGKPATRADVAEILYCLAGETVTTEVVTYGYIDIVESMPYAEAVSALSQAGLFNGVGGGRFAPDQAMTKGQTIAVLTRLLGITPMDSAGGWATGYLAAAQEHGIGLDFSVEELGETISIDDLQALIACLFEQ